MIRTFLFSALILTPAAADPQEKEPPYQIPTPAGWAKETIVLPPAFAPAMKWRGTEELRFAPGMFKAEAPDFLSYALLFWLPDDAEIDAKTMERELLALNVDPGDALTRLPAHRPRAFWQKPIALINRLEARLRFSPAHPSSPLCHSRSVSGDKCCHPPE